MESNRIRYSIGNGCGEVNGRMLSGSLQSEIFGIIKVPKAVLRCDVSYALHVSSCRSIGRGMSNSSIRSFLYA